MNEENLIRLLLIIGIVSLTVIFVCQMLMTSMVAGILPIDSGSVYSSTL